jgi:UDP-glucose 4-epimerase
MHRRHVLVTGGCGYIGSHTIVALQEAGHDVICVDNHSNSDPSVLAGIESITHRTVRNYCVDLCDGAAVATVFADNPNIDSVIHFAAFKAVGESVSDPLKYYRNNIQSLLTILELVAAAKGVRDIIFSSSCTVYGEPATCPVSEETPEKPAESPYGATKQMCERILRDFVARGGASERVTLLRYFNPSGAHPSLKIGEAGYGPNLVPRIVGVAAGAVGAAGEPFRVFGGDYPTEDGSAVRDFIHVCDIADAHRLALERPPLQTSPPRVLNLGLGCGASVLSVLRTFMAVNGVVVPYEVVGRRTGDISAVYADNRRACLELGWRPKYGLEDIVRTAWAYEQSKRRG